MIVDSYFQLYDRWVIEKLKADNFSIDGQIEKSTTALANTERLERALSVLQMDAHIGRGKPVIFKSNRFHDHKEAQEGDWGLPDTVEKCQEALKECHRRYWKTQTEIQSIKTRIGTTSNPSWGALERFWRLQLIIDECNQLRNDLIGRGDELFVGEFYST